MNRLLRTAFLALAVGLSGVTAGLAAGDETAAVVSLEDRESYETEARQDLDRMNTETAGISPETPEYNDFQSALDEAEEDWQALKAASAEEWEDVKESFEASWAKVESEYQKLVE